MMAKVIVDTEDLRALADLVVQFDRRDQSPEIEKIGEAHDLIIKMLGEHAESVYAPADGSEVAA
jgi:hypothetical protein